MEKVARFKTAYEHLKSLGKVHKQKDVGDAMNVAASNISKAFKGEERFLTPSFLTRFNNTFGNIFNNEWLTDDIGEMLATDGKIKVNLLNTPIPMGSAVESPENAAKNGKIQRMTISFEELMGKYEDMTAQRDYWRNKAAELEYKLAKLEAV